MPGQVSSYIFCCGSTSSTICSNCYTWNWNPRGPNNWWVMQGMLPFCRWFGWLDQVFFILFPFVPLTIFIKIY